VWVGLRLAVEPEASGVGRYDSPMLQLDQPIDGLTYEPARRF
jgi:hypothetical protein